MPRLHRLERLSRRAQPRCPTGRLTRRLTRRLHAARLELDCAAAFEVLVAFLQAYIFTILAAVYIGGAAHPEH